MAVTDPRDPGDPTDPLVAVPGRAPDRRPRAVLVDVYGTLLRLDPLSARFVDIGRPPEENRLFFARLLRDGMAFTLAGPGPGGAPPFADVVRAALRTVVGPEVSAEALDHVLDGLRALPPFGDVEPAVAALARARVPVHAFTHGDPVVTTAALDRVGLRTYLRTVVSTQDDHAFRPAQDAYHGACARIGAAPDRTAVLSAHAWDVHGAVRAGLLGALVTRFEGELTPLVDRPHVSAERLDDTVVRLLGLPG